MRWTNSPARPQPEGQLDVTLDLKLALNVQLLRSGIALHQHEKIDLARNQPCAWISAATPHLSGGFVQSNTNDSTPPLEATSDVASVIVH